MLRDALLLPAHRVHVVTNGCAVEAIAARASAGRNRVRDNTSARRLLMVAWLARAKDHATAIRAVANLRQRGHNVKRCSQTSASAKNWLTPRIVACRSDITRAAWRPGMPR